MTCAVPAAAQVGTLANPDLDEISGLTRSLRSPEILWAHNDSGDGPVLYRVGTEGEDLGRVTIPGAQAIDWEDIAAFEHRGTPALLVADVGDNRAVRNRVTLYAVADPGMGNEARLLWRLDFRYPEGPRDCEGVAIDTVKREILLLTKRDRPPRLYRLPIPEETPREPLVAEFLGTVTTIEPTGADDRKFHPRKSKYFDQPTGFDLSPDGRTAVVLTPRNAWLYRRKPDQPWRDVFTQRPRRVPLPHFVQIESVAVSADGQWLYVASEQKPMGFARLRLVP